MTTKIFKDNPKKSTEREVKFSNSFFYNRNQQINLKLNSLVIIKFIQTLIISGVLFLEFSPN